MLTKTMAFLIHIPVSLLLDPFSKNFLIFAEERKMYSV